MTPSPDPSSPTWSALGDEACDLVAAATGEGLVVRVVGSTGIRLHCAAALAAQEQAGRGAKDVDLVVRSRDRKALRALIEARGYAVDHDVLVAMEGRRFCFANPTTGIDVDVFVDPIQFSHKLDLSDRLERHPLTIPVEDLLLQKLQVHDLTRTDVIDAVALLGTHPVATDDRVAEDPERIDGGYVADLLAHDWGFHHTAMANLASVEAALCDPEAAAIARPDTAAAALDGAQRLRAAIDGADKSRGWRMRARIGERMQWWEDVDEREAAY